MIFLLDIFNFKIVQHHLQQGFAGPVQINLSAFVLFSTLN